jgi:hypothetical protein
VRVAVERDGRVRVPGDRLDELDVGARRDETRPALGRARVGAEAASHASGPAAALPQPSRSAANSLIVQGVFGREGMRKNEKARGPSG